MACDCYPYAASSSTLDLKQVTDAHDILVTWSDPHPEQGGKMLAQVAADWGTDLIEAARRAGVSPAAPYRHFKGRDDLLEEGMDVLTEAFSAALG